jgi:hypothetical protein
MNPMNPMMGQNMNTNPNPMMGGMNNPNMQQQK